MGLPMRWKKGLRRPAKAGAVVMPVTAMAAIAPSVVRRSIAAMTCPLPRKNPQREPMANRRLMPNSRAGVTEIQV